MDHTNYTITIAKIIIICHYSVLFSTFRLSRKIPRKSLKKKIEKITIRKQIAIGVVEFKLCPTQQLKKHSQLENNAYNVDIISEKS